jgi:hypothetical protein
MKTSLSSPSSPSPKTSTPPAPIPPLKCRASSTLLKETHQKKQGAKTPIPADFWFFQQKKQNSKTPRFLLLNLFIYLYLKYMNSQSFKNNKALRLFLYLAGTTAFLLYIFFGTPPISLVKLPFSCRSLHLLKK